MKLRWNTLGGKLGLFFCVAGFALMWAGWNGAASYNDIRKQFPYLKIGRASCRERVFQEV
jgi:hypothetical protein